MTDLSEHALDDSSDRSEVDAASGQGSGTNGSSSGESSNVLSALAHDLNNILARVTTYADLLAISLQACPEHDDVLEIKNAALAGAELVRKLTVLSRTPGFETLADGSPAPERPVS